MVSAWRHALLDLLLFVVLTGLSAYLWVHQRCRWSPVESDNPIGYRS